MPIPGTSAAKGYSVAGVEFGTNTPGMQSLLTDTAVTGLPASLSNSIPASATAGMRLVVFAYNHTAAGTITITGTAPLSLAAVNETTTSLPVMERPGEVSVYVTTNKFAAVNASGVTLGGGLTNGRIQIFGIQGGNRLIPGITKLMEKTKEHTPNLQRGTYDLHYDLIALQQECSWDWETDGYPDDTLWLLLGAYNASPTITTLPAAPTAILASTSVVTGASVSAALQPLVPGQALQCVIGGAPATAATVSITGTNLYGETVTEVIVPSSKTAGTYYSQTVFASIAASGITYGAFGGSATLTVNGVFGYKFAGNPGDTLNSYNLEQWDSQGNWTAPFSVVEEVTWEFGMEEQLKVAAKGLTQAVLPVGDTSVNTDQITALVQSQDRAEAGWESVVWIDSISGTAGTTANLDVLKGKITLHNPWKYKYTSAFSPVPLRYPSRVYRGKRYMEVELELDMTPATLNSEVQAYYRRQKRQLRIQVKGVLLGTSAGTTWWKGWQFDVAGRYVDTPERTFTASDESVTVKLKLLCEVDAALGYGFNVTQYSQFGAW